MKISEFIKLDHDIDVYDDVCEELGIAFCGPIELTPEGSAHFAEVLEYDIEINDSCAVVCIDGPGNSWSERLRKAKEFFEAAAGYCADSDYQKWFIE